MSRGTETSFAQRLLLPCPYPWLSQDPRTLYHLLFCLQNDYSGKHMKVNHTQRAKETTRGQPVG